MDLSDVRAFGEALALFRTRARLSQQHLADKLGGSRRTVAAWEAGDNLPKTKEVVIQIADVLGLNGEETTMLLKTVGMDPSPRIWNVPFPRNPYFTGRIFCGYAHEDEMLFQELNRALAILRRQEAISIWHYGNLLPGAQWEWEIERELNTADIILLLISPAFMASDYCYSKEMQWALTRHFTGEARVIPIILRPVSDWKTTPLGALQALPKDAKPITTWSNRDEAFADVVTRLRKAIQDIQHEDKYPVREYVLGLRPSVYESEGNSTVQDQAKRVAEQWITTVTNQIGGVLQDTIQQDDRKEWMLTNHKQACHISMQWNYRGMDTLSRYFRSADLTITSQHPALLDHMIEKGHLSYWFLQWTLDDLDVVSLASQIVEQTGDRFGHYPKAMLNVVVQDSQVIEQTGNRYSPLNPRNDPVHYDYKLYNGEKHRVRATLSSKGPSSPARVCLIHDNTPLQGFYHAHTLLSVQKVLAMLHGKTPYREIRQLIEKACMP